MVHGYKKFELQPKSFPAYRYFAECLCGFQCRTSTEAATKSQLDNHLLAHGVPAYFSGASPTLTALEPTIAKKPITPATTSGWSPFKNETPKDAPKIKGFSKTGT